MRWDRMPAHPPTRATGKDGMGWDGVGRDGEKMDGLEWETGSERRDGQEWESGRAGSGKVSRRWCSGGELVML